MKRGSVARGRGGVLQSLVLRRRLRRNVYDVLLDRPLAIMRDSACLPVLAKCRAVSLRSRALLLSRYEQGGRPKLAAKCY